MTNIDRSDELILVNRGASKRAAHTKTKLNDVQIVCCYHVVFSWKFLAELKISAFINLWSPR